MKYLQISAAALFRSAAVVGTDTSCQCRPALHFFSSDVLLIFIGYCQYFAAAATAAAHLPLKYRLILYSADAPEAIIHASTRF